MSDMQVSSANVTFDMAGRATKYDDAVMAGEGEDEPVRAAGDDVRPREKEKREEQKIWSRIMSGKPVWKAG
ncbi:hypothetical protein LZ31DRAFT_557071 [Colletotrichum somersetense]|nr:hypothetical protein LZ31DRAFT_557071 [Colletotrichum somersetense]